MRHLAAGEIRADADHVGGRADGDVERALDGAAAGFAHAHRDGGVEQPRRRGQCVDLHGEGRLAVVADQRQVGQRYPCRFAFLLVGEAERIAGEARPFALGRERHFALDRKTGSRRAIEEAAVDGDVRSLAGGDFRLVRSQVELDPVGHEVLDQEHLGRDGRLLRIGVDRDRPGAAHGGGRQRQVDGVAACRCAVRDDAPVLDAVGAREDEGQRQVIDGKCGAVAGKGRDMHILAGAVDAALGPGIDVERAGRLAPLDAAVGQVEAGARHVEEDEVLVAVRRHQHRRHHAAFAAAQARIEGGAAVGVGLGRAEDFVVLGKQRQVDAGHRLRRAERARKDVEPVLPGIGGKADVGDDEPLRGARIPAVAAVVLGLGGHHIDAGLAVGQRLVDRKARRHFLVEFVGDREFAFPDRLSHLVGNAGEVVAVELAQELVAGEKLGQRPVADAEELDVGHVHVDGDDRDAAPCGRRQHEAVAGEARRRSAILNVDRQHDRPFEHFADRRRQALPEGDAVVLPVLQALDADLASLSLDALRRRLVDGDEGRVVDAGLDQILRELRADARRGGVGLDRMLDDAEALARLQVFIFGADGSGIHQRKACLIGLERRTEQVAPVEPDGDHCQRIGARRGGAQQQVGIVGRRGGVALQLRGFLAVDALHRKHGAGEFQPQPAVIRQDRDRSGEFLHRGARVAGQKRGVAGVGEGGKALLADSDAAVGQARAHRLGLVGHPVGEVAEFGRRADVGIAADRDDLAGHRVGKRLDGGEIRLEEAPFGLGVVGEGAALAVAQAGGLALVERDVLLRSQVEAEIVGIRCSQDLAGFDRPCSIDESKEKERKNR